MKEKTEALAKIRWVIWLKLSNEPPLTVEKVNGNEQ